jgi:enoyl-CoA hydratase/carnithine racemase
MRSSAETVLLEELSGGVLRLTLNRPAQRNAIDAELRDSLADAIDRAGEDETVRAVLIDGADGSFCAGGDLARFGDLHGARTYRHISHRLTDVGAALERLELPVVAAIDGVATGAGLALALACDWRIGSGRARILFREGQVGLIPTHGGTTRLVKLLGLARAKELLLGGDDLDADGALAAGVLHELVADPDQLHERSLERIDRMLERAPLSFGVAKRLLQQAADVDLASGILAESLGQAALLQSEDHHEGIAAISERRPPAFKGR